MTFRPDERLLQLETAVRAFRRRFWLALLGYCILAAGLVVAFYFIWDRAQELEDTQRGAIELIRCVDHPRALNCDDLPTYQSLLDEVGD
jgi:hypothetical protein